MTCINLNKLFPEMRQKQNNLLPVIRVRQHVSQRAGERRRPAVLDEMFLRVVFKSSVVLFVFGSGSQTVSDCRQQSCLGISVCWLMNSGFTDGWLPQLHFGGGAYRPLWLHNLMSVLIQDWLQFLSSLHAAEEHFLETFISLNILSLRRTVRSVWYALS